MGRCQPGRVNHGPSASRSTHAKRGAACTAQPSPLAVNPVFLDWLRRTQPTKADRVENLIRSTRDGGLNDATFGRRMRGTGVLADQIQQTFSVFTKKLGLDPKIVVPSYMARVEESRSANPRVRFLTRR